jgi:3',5'-cyclic AMP phosphodiesterase CpdA
MNTRDGAPAAPSGAQLMMTSIAQPAPAPRAPRVAHLSDLHLLERRPTWRGAAHALRTRFLSFGRRLDAEERVRKVQRALAAAAGAGADHVVISGDLTEIGSDDQFEHLAEVLHDGPFAPSRVTLVPGNHDVYADPRGWDRAIAGPLRAFASSSARAVGDVVEAAGVTFLPLDVTVHQPVTSAAGELGDDDADRLSRRISDPRFAGRPMVLVQHHSPIPHRSATWQRLDGLRGWPRLMQLLERHPELQVLHGHLHYVVDALLRHARARVLGAPAVVEEKGGAPRIRVYEARDGMLESLQVIAA